MAIVLKCATKAERLRELQEELAKRKITVPRSPTGDCNKCAFWKPMNSKLKGVRIPGSFGK